jgi:peptide deformylase
MAIRMIRKEGDEILRKKSRDVGVIDERITQLLDDMLETMDSANGVGLAAVQVGVLKRVVVIDVGEGPIELINPVFMLQEGEQNEAEGCLSVPEKFGEVKRPNKVIVEAMDRHGERFTVEGEGLLAIALCHELDHLDGILFIDKVTKFIEPSSEERH